MRTRHIIQALVLSLFFVACTRPVETKRTNNNHWSYNLDFVDMCYCLDSYLGLGYGYINNAINPHERPVSWTVKAASTASNNSYWYYHRLHVDYGNLIPVNPGNDD